MRRLTEDIPGTGGRIRVEIDDFVVEEMPLYPPSGAGDPSAEGEHVMFEIEKRGIATHEAVRRLARALSAAEGGARRTGRALGVRPEAFGFAGRKDARAVARQWLTVYGADAASVARAEVPGVKVLSASPHRSKLRTGHLRGNRFRVRVRGAKPGAVAHAEAALAVLADRGVPNRFGPQRFGERGDSHLLGAALVKGDHDEALALLLGRPSDADPPAVRRAREAYEAGDLRAALEALPSSRRDERACLAALARDEKPARAIRKMPKRARLFLVSALQSHLFNGVLDERMPAIDRVETGDLAYKHDSGAVFRVEDAEAENERAARFEISPSGPMFGYKMIEPEGRPGELERNLLESAGLAPEDFRRAKGIKSKGARRPLRVALSEHAVEAAGAKEDEAGDLWLNFALPPGSYATVVLDEVMKPDA